MTALLQFQEISFSYTNGKILDAVDFRLLHGECAALIGPNGAGKTTLLRIAAGMLPSSSGEVLLEGQSISTYSHIQLARKIALVPQQLEIPFQFTVEQVVEQGRTPYLSFFGGLRKRDRESVENAIELTDIQSLRHRVFNELSGGERQRVKIALGLAQDPSLLLLDEPTQNLDIGRQVEVLALIRKLQRQGITILAAVHDLQLIQGTFSSVLLLSPEDGLRQGDPEEILQPRLLEKAFRCPPDEHPIFLAQERAL
jgi:iron complex transport system ATP-binding protein